MKRRGKFLCFINFLKRESLNSQCRQTEERGGKKDLKEEKKGWKEKFITACRFLFAL